MQSQAALGKEGEASVMPILEVFAHLTVRPGQLEGFRKQAAECIRITQEKDTRTLTAGPSPIPVAAGGIRRPV